MKRPPTKRARVLKAFKARRKRGISPISALELCGTIDLASHVRHLKIAGHRIRTGETQRRYATYTNDDGKEVKYLVSSWVTYYYEGHPDEDKQMEMTI